MGTVAWHAFDHESGPCLAAPGHRTCRLANLTAAAALWCPQAAQLWRSLWRTLQERNQALAIQLPAADGSSDGEEGGSASPSGEGGSGSAERLFLYLVPNDYEQVQPTMFGLLGVPLPEPEHPRPCSARQPPGSILRRRRPNDGDDDSGAQGVLPAAAAEEAVAAAAAAEPATADGSALQAAAAAVPTELAAAAPEPATGGGEPAAASVQPAASESEEEGELSPTAAAPAAAPAAAAAGEARHQLGWADVCGDRSALDRLDRAALELGKGSHYATPTRLAAGAARPARTPLIRSFEQLVEAEAAGSEGPLTGLHVARWGFDKHIDMQDPVRVCCVQTAAGCAQRWTAALPGMAHQASSRWDDAPIARPPRRRHCSKF